MFTKRPKDQHDKDLFNAIQLETENFQECYLWLEKAMPAGFFKEVGQENVMLITHSLMGFPMQDYFSLINLKNAAIVLCLDSPDADLKILKNFALHGISHYRTYVSKVPPPFKNCYSNLRIALISIAKIGEEENKAVPEELYDDLYQHVKTNNPNITEEKFDEMIAGIDRQFLLSLTPDQLAMAFDMFIRAQTRDLCQYEVSYNEFWMHPGSKKGNASMNIVLAWRNTPKHNFLYLLARMIHRHKLVMRGVNAAYFKPLDKNNILIMSIGLHGSRGQDVWEVADIPDFLRELVTIKYFARFDKIDEKLVSQELIKGSYGNLLRAMTNFIHQSLVYIDPNIYTIKNIEWDLCRLPELTEKICEAFKAKFAPEQPNLKRFRKLKKEILQDVEKLDTGHEERDKRRKNIYKQAVNFITYTLKTNFYRYNYSSLCFRLDPAYITELPFDYRELFPEIPFAVFYVKGMHFFGFHIRFKDLARGGLRTIYPEQSEKMLWEADHIFHECYHLALTQHKKNKEIPEGGAKGVIFMEPFDRLEGELKTFRRELEITEDEDTEMKRKISDFKRVKRTEYIQQAQRSFVQSLISIVNYREDGSLLAHHVVDYLKKPENIYIGPDENMLPASIEWIAAYAKKVRYRPGSSFITSKPHIGINHKEFGITSSGVNIYMEEVLKFMNIDPFAEKFTLKMSGGPDGDVAGNQIINLAHKYPNTAKILALTDGTGTIYDPRGLDLPSLVALFHEVKGISHYPVNRLNEGGFLVDLHTIRNPTPFVQRTLCLRKEGEKVVEDWLSSSDMNYLYRHFMHKVKTDLFIPAGGRPKTLNLHNFTDFLDEDEIPTSRAIIEGANLYFDWEARRELEKLGVLIIKDSSANKAGVICSSFEAFSGLAIKDETFIEMKNQLTEEIIEAVGKLAYEEAQLLLSTFKETGDFLTDISDKISAKINKYTYELLDYLEERQLPSDPEHPLIQIFLSFCPPTLRTLYREEVLKNIPDQHKKAVIACHLGSQLIYSRGLDWSPTIVDILPILLKENTKFSR